MIPTPLDLVNALISDEFKCAVCLDTLTDTHVNPECGHRFCGECIKKSIHKCRNECPSCRVHITTYRSLRRDPHFDRILLKLGEVLEALTHNVSKEENPDRNRSNGEHVNRNLDEDLHKKNEDESGHCGSNRTKSISSAVNSKLRNKRVHSEIGNEDTSDDDDDESVLSSTAETSTVTEPVPNLEGEIHRFPRNQVNLRAKRSQSQRKSRRITRRPPYLADDDAFFNVTAREYCSQNVQQEEINGNKELRSRSLVTNKQGKNHDRLPRKQVKLGSRRFPSQRLSRRISRRPPYLADDDAFFNVTARKYCSQNVQREESNQSSSSLVANQQGNIYIRLPKNQVCLQGKSFQSQRRSRRITRRPPYLADDDAFFNVTAREYSSKAVEQEEPNKGGIDLRSRSLVTNQKRQIRSRLPKNQVVLGSKRFQSQRKSMRITRRPPYLADDDAFFNVSARKYSSKAVQQEGFNKGDKSLRFGSLVMNTWRIDPSVYSMCERI